MSSKAPRGAGRSGGFATRLEATSGALAAAGGSLFSGFGGGFLFSLHKSGMFERIKYVKDQENYSSYSLDLKQIPCPYCYQIGYLNRHGFLKGYGEKHDEEIIRGYRIFCCNRDQRLGCGKTHSVLLSAHLWRHSIKSSEVTMFLNRLLVGKSLEVAWFCSAKKRCLETGRAIWRRFSRTHLGIRSKIFGKENRSSQKEPRLVTWEATLERFRSSDPIGDYQLYFQQAFFSSG